MASRKARPDRRLFRVLTETCPSTILRKKEWQGVADSLGLTERQLEIVQCVVDGLDEVAIGDHLDLSRHTVHAHISRLYQRLDVNSQASLVALVFVVHLSRKKKPRTRKRKRATVKR